jgi:hypothetical protein
LVRVSYRLHDRIAEVDSLFAVPDEAALRRKHKEYLEHIIGQRRD